MKCYEALDKLASRSYPTPPMATHPSAAKRNRQNVKRNARNTAFRSRMRKAIREARAAMAEGSDDKATLVAQAIRLVQKTASKSVIHKNTASRYVSRLSAALKASN